MTKISDLPPAGAIAGDELVAIVQNGTTKKTAVSSVAQTLNAISSLPPATTVDPNADLLIIDQGGVNAKVTPQELFTPFVQQIPIMFGYSYVFGLLPPGAALFNIRLGFTTIFPAGLAGSYGDCGAAPTGNISLPIISGGLLSATGLIVGGTQIGSVNYAAGSRLATFTFSALQNLAVGTTLGIGMDPNGDATFANPSITMIGGR